MSNWCKEKNCYCNNTTDFGYCKTTVCIKSEKTSTVKAIPVEYIQKWNNNYIADTMRNGRTIINQMLEDWEKENEQRETINC